MVVPAGNEAPLTNPAVCVVVEPGQLSVPAGVVKLTMAPHKPVVLFTVILEGQMIAGAWLSSTVTVKLHIPVFPTASVTL